MAFKPTNRLGWTRQAFDRFFEETKPGSTWSFIKKNYKDRNKKADVSRAIDKMYSLFRSESPYKPLADAFSKLGFAYQRVFLELHQTDHGQMSNFYQARNDSLSEFERLLIPLQARIQRLWDFARTESLVKDTSSEVASRHAAELISAMRRMLYQKYRNTQMVDNMMKVFTSEIKQDLKEGNESHGDYNEIDITFDAWEARYVDGTPDDHEIRLIRDGKRF